MGLSGIFWAAASRKTGGNKEERRLGLHQTFPLSNQDQTSFLSEPGVTTEHGRRK